MEKKLRIAIITNNYTPYSGGVVSSINAFADQLMASGHKVIIITLDFLGKPVDPPYVMRIPSVARFMYKKNNCAVPWLAQQEIARVLEDFDPDVVHLQHPFLICQSALRVARRMDIPAVFTYHSVYEKYSHHAPLLKPLVERAVTEKVLRFCDKVDHIIAPSQGIRDYLLEKKVQAPITVIPSPLQAEFLGNPSWDRKNGRLRLLLVSRFAKEKNVPLALDVFFQLDPERFSLTIVGYGQEEQFLRDYAYQHLGLSKAQVKFIIKPPKSELIQAYRDADLFLFPSNSDTQGLVLAESMAGGTPVVAVDGPGQRDIIMQGKNGFIIQTPQEMIKKIEQIADDDDLLEKLKLGALKTAQNYSPSILCQRLVEVYRAIVVR